MATTLEHTQQVAWRRPRLALATVAFVLFLTFLDNTVVSVVLADVQSGLHAGVGGLQWVVNGYALTFAGLMLVFGTLGDVFGRKKVMLGGVAVFCAGSVIGALAPDTSWLIAGRVVMGIGAAASEPGTLSMIRHLYPEQGARARAYGVWSAVSGLALALGPVIGGVLAGLWSWRAVFWFNVAFGLIALAGAWLALPEQADPVDRRLDIGGFALGAAALTAAAFAVIAGETAGYRTWWVDLLFAGGLVGIVGFVHVERRAAHPVLDVRAFRRPAFSGSNVVAFTTFFSVFSLFFFVALYLQDVGSSSPYATALDFVPMAAGMVVASIVAGRWLARSGPRPAMTLGCLLAGAGVLLTDVRLSPSAGLAQVGWTMAVAGVGFGLALVPVTSSAMSVIEPERSGMAASMTNTSRELGAVAGVAILGSIINGQLTVELVKRLAAIGIPKQFRDMVVTAVTTGTFNSQASSAAAGNASIAQIVHKILHAAYAAFAHGVDLALLLSCALMLGSAVVAWTTLRVAPAQQAQAARVT